MKRYYCYLKEKEINLIMAGIILIIMAISLGNINEFDQIAVLNDEFGYWSIGAYIAGKDWSLLASQAPYYSYGYSVLLTPFFLVFNSPEIMYKAAILLNALLLLGSFGLTYRLSKKLYSRMDKRFLLFVSFAITIYSSNIVQVHVAWSETLLCFLYWAVANLVYDIIKERSMWKCILLSFLSVYAYAVHQRTLGILAMSIIIIVLLKVVRRIGWKSFFSFIGILLIGIFIQRQIKDYFLINIFQNNELVANNDYSGQIGKFVLLFSKDGLIYFIQSLFGKAYYLGISTFLFFYWGVGTAVKNCFSGLKVWLVKRKELSDEAIFALFGAGSFAATFMITVIFTLVPGRIDTLIYGRYNEFAIGLILLFGIMAFWKTSSAMKPQGICFILLGIFAKVVNGVLEELGNSSFAMINAIGVSGFFENNVSPNNTVYLSVVFVGIISLICLGFFEQKRNRKLKIFSIVIVAANWLLIGQGVVNNLLLPMQSDQKKNISLIADCVDEAGEGELYYVKSSETRDVNIEYFQFLLPDTTVHSVPFYDLKNMEIKDNSYILFLNTDKNIQKMFSEYRIIGQSPNYVLMTRIGNDIDHKFKEYCKSLDIDPLKCLSNNREELEEQLISNGNKGYLIKNKYLTLSAGTYEMEINMTVNDMNQADLGYIEILRSGRTEHVEKVPIYREDFDGKSTVNKNFTFNCNNSYSDVELRLMTKKGVHLQVNKISCRRISNQYKVGTDTKEELKQYAQLLSEIGGEFNLYYYMENKNLEFSLNFEYLENIFQVDEITGRDRIEMIRKADSEATEYILMEKPTDIFDYQELLKDYTILDRGKYYILLVNSNSVVIRKSIEMGNAVLSGDGTVKMNFYSENKGSILMNSEDFKLYKGSYMVDVDLRILKISAEKVGRIEVYYGDKILNSRDLLKKDIQENILHIEFPISSFYDMGNVTIGVSNASEAEFIVENISLCKLSDNYFVDIENYTKDSIQNGENVVIESPKVSMTTGSYVARYTVELLSEQPDNNVGTLLVKGEEVKAKPVKITKEDFEGERQAIIEVPFTIGFDIITLEDINTKVGFSIKYRSKCRIKSIEIEEKK